MVLMYFLNDFKMVWVSPIITGITPLQYYYYYYYYMKAEAAIWSYGEGIEDWRKLQDE
jgi:hypothetical protein